MPKSQSHDWLVSSKVICITLVDYTMLMCGLDRLDNMVYTWGTLLKFI